MRHRGLISVLLLGFGLVSLGNAQDSKMEKEQQMEKESKMQKDSKMKKDSKMQMESKMKMDKGSMMKEVALNEYCPVAYAAAGKAMKGDAMYSSTYKGKTYYFVGTEPKKMFDAAPTKFLPQYDGNCATAMAMGKKIESDPEIFSVYKGSTYLFSSKEAKAAFDNDPNAIIANADKHFAAKGKM